MCKLGTQQLTNLQMKRLRKEGARLKKNQYTNLKKRPNGGLLQKLSFYNIVIGPEFQRKAFQNCFRWEIVFLVRLKISISKTRKTHYLNMFRISTRLDLLLTILNFRSYHAVPFLFCVILMHWY